MSGYKVSGISHIDMVAMVQRRLNSLAMCKRGVLSTSEHEALALLPDRPKFTKKELEVIQDGLMKRTMKALTPTLTIMKRYNGNIQDVISHCRYKAEALRKGCFIHPDLKKWEQDREAIEQQYKERGAELDSEFQDATDEFVLGIRKIQDLPEVYNRLESKQW